MNYEREEQFARQFEDYLNDCHSVSDYRYLAEHISQTMHRHTQSEGWKFIKELIRAFARGGYDGRNETAKKQAGMVHEYMRDMHIIGE